MNPEAFPENPRGWDNLKLKFLDRTKKISYPIAWVEYYKEKGKDKLILQVACGYLV